MSLSLDQSPEAELLRFLARFAGVSTGSAASGPVRVRLSKSSELRQPLTIARFFCRQADREAELLGADALEQARVAMWLDVAAQLLPTETVAAAQLWRQLDDALLHQTFVAAPRATLADAALFWALRGAVAGWAPAQRDAYAAIARWFDQLQHTVGVRGFRGLDLVALGSKQLALTV